MNGPIRGILFDLGDTLLDFGAVKPNRLFVRGASLAYDYLRGLGKRLPSRRLYLMRQLWAIRWAYFKTRFTHKEFDSLQLLKDRSRRMGHPLSDEEALELAWQFYLPLKEASTVEPQMRQTLQRLGDRGLTLGVVSNTFLPGQILDRQLEQEGIIDLLPFRVYSSDLGIRKPDRRIFEHALEATGLQPQQTLFVGDTPREDISGAHQAGMVTVLKDPTGLNKAVLPAPDYTIRAIADLEQIVSRRNDGP